ncbi:hypothetical protein RD792_001396 [Penstemon davidsonii]|uniref:Heptahelical transmembrane protein 4-like n=1 Tax=Penstemon davidsonii TaxID=160366 RepID=A0ABR0DNA4_9LAMI|nr:hypothetical protein RD792_001396 [Penstemon davidsonii]
MNSCSGLNENDEIVNSSMRERKGKRLWKKVKHELVDYHSLPPYLKDNEYIHRHYRCEWPLRQVLFSLFTIHNETLNVWTHLIGFFLFLSLTIYTAMKVPNIVDFPSLQSLPDVLRKADFHKLHTELITCLSSLAHMPDLPSLSNWRIMELLSNCLPVSLSYNNKTDIHLLVRFTSTFMMFVLSIMKKCFNIFESLNSLQRNMKDDMANLIAPLIVRPITRWPFFAFLGGAMFCLLASSTCHLLSCHSQRLSYIMLRLDYAGIAALISTSFYPPVYYSFMCYPFFCNLYMGLITLLGIATILASLLPVFQSPEYRKFRASLFFGMGFSGAVPIFHKLILFWHQPEALHTTCYEVLMGALYGVGALVYAMRVPERWMPGKFDIAGHSHQLFHVLVVAGAYTHYQAGLVYLRWRDQQGC